MTDQEFEPVTMVFRDSAIYRAVSRTLERTRVAMHDSALKTRLRHAAAPLTRAGAGHTLAVVATTLAWASIAHLAMRAVLPRYATSGLPWWWNVMVAVFAVLIAALAPVIAAAWHDSTPARMWRRAGG